MGTDYLSAHEGEPRGRAAQYKKILCQRALWSYNWSEVMQALWKTMAVLGHTYANNIPCRSSGVWEFLKRRQREKGKLAQSVHKHASVSSLKGDEGALIHGKKCGAQGELRTVEAPRAKCRTQDTHPYHLHEQLNTWTRRTATLCWRFGLPALCLEKVKEKQRTRLGEGVQHKVQEMETAAWQKSFETKLSLVRYLTMKLEI